MDISAVVHFIRSIRKEISVFSLTSWPVMTKRNEREKHKHLYKKPLKSMDALLLPLKKRPMDTKGSLPTSYQKANLVGAGTWYQNKDNCQRHPERQLAKRDCWAQSPPRLQTPRTPARGLRGETLVPRTPACPSWKAPLLPRTTPQTADTTYPSPLVHGLQKAGERQLAKTECQAQTTQWAFG